MGVITFNGKTSEDYGFVVEHPPAYKMPQQDVTATHVPGRNGDVLYFRDSYQNVTRSYEIAFAVPEDGSYATYEKFVRHAMEWLNQTGSNRGYKRLYDTYDPYIFRMAYYAGGLDLNNIYNQGGRGTINFVCKPQKFYTAYDSPITVDIANGDSITNPTEFDSNPLISITGSGDLTVAVLNGATTSTINITDLDGTIYIDSELKDAYSLYADTYVNMNSKIGIDDFITLKPGTNQFWYSGDGTITDMEVTPRCWTL